MNMPKISPKLFQADTMKCPVCLSEQNEKISTYTKPPYEFYDCRDCKLIYANPMKSGDAEWYTNFEVYAVPENPDPKLKWYENYCIHIVPSWKEKKVLNIGCGTTTFLKELQDKGADVYGIDINNNMIEFTKNKLGVSKCQCIDIDSFIDSYNDSGFDYILFFEVLEHLEAPGQFITRLEKILKNDGCIICSVPNRNRYLPSKNTSWDYPPHHLTRWSIYSLQNAFTTKGYEVNHFAICPISPEDFLRITGFDFGVSYFEKVKYKKFFAKKFIKPLVKIRTAIYKVLALFTNAITPGKGNNLFIMVSKKKSK